MNHVMMHFKFSSIVAVAEENVHFLQHQLDHIQPENKNGHDDFPEERQDSTSFQFIFAQNSTHYFKHSIVLEMDDSIGDIKSIILDRQKMLMLQIEDSLLDAEPMLQQASVIMATLDALISLGRIYIIAREGG